MHNSIEFSSVKKVYHVPSLLPWKMERIEALKGVDFFCPAERLSCILGPNGAGKTTIVKIVAGLIYHDSGSIRINGREVNTKNGMAGSIGVMTPNDRSFYWRLSGRENLDFFCALNGFSGREKKTMMNRIFEDVGLEKDADKPYRLYSTGMKQRLLIARALIGSPEILLLDEPSSHLDPIARENLHHLIKEVFIGMKKMTVLLCTHDLSEAEKLADHIILLNSGNVLKQGNYSDLSTMLESGAALDIEFRGRFKRGIFSAMGLKPVSNGAGLVRVELKSMDDIPAIIRGLAAGGLEIISCVPVRSSLFDIYSKEAGSEQ